MAETEIEGYTLGQKHQHYNRLVHDAVKSNKTIKSEDFNSENSDVNNLIIIDLASHERNVEYILKVFACEDMLYVSRAISRSTWLITDQNYAHIINAEYLYTKMFPQMTSKAISKIIKHIRNNLNDEKRSKEFYTYEENPKEAVKWLPLCSLEFIQEHLMNHRQHLKTTLLRRLCEKSITVLEMYIKNDDVHTKRDALQANMFLLTSNTNKYLDIVETVSDYDRPTFNKRATSFLMKNNTSRLINKFANYFRHIHLKTFIKFLKPENIKDFLLNQARNIEKKSLFKLFHLKHLTLFIESMPKEIRFEFVKFVFIDKKHLDSKENSLLSEEDTKAMNMLCEITCNHFRYSEHIWYQFAPFDIALQIFKELIESVPFARQNITVLEVLLKSAQRNLTHERIFLECLSDKKKNTESCVKAQIVNKILCNLHFIRYDQSTWNVLDDIIKSMDIYSESENKQSTIIEAIILYNVVHESTVPEIIEKKFYFNTLKSYHKKLSEKEKEIVFNYLHGVIMAKLVKCNATNETEFKEKLKVLEKALILLKDFKKELENYPDLISLLKDLIKIRNDSSWTASMETLFNINKTWRKLLFEESLALCPSESVVLNALKHDPSLLEHNKSIVQKILYNDKIALKHVLGKIKIYWPNSMAKNITVRYTEKLNMLGDHKATTRGLSILLSRPQLMELIKKYAPKEPKINWDKIDEVDLSVQQQFAKNMHNSRPQPIPETVLWFAKGDYLQYALPSLLSIFYNLSSTSSRNYIPQLLDAPVSLQKHGIRLAMTKMGIGELVSTFSKIWNNNNNASIRSVMFKNVYGVLCKEKNPLKIQTTWELLETFIDNLTFNEDKAIYKLLFKVKNVPLAVRGRFYMKSYIFLHKLVNSGNKYEEYKNEFYTTFATYSIEIMDQLHPNYVPEIIKEYIDREFMKNRVAWHFSVVNVISSYLLDATDEETQIGRYENVLRPILEQSFALWATEDKDGEKIIIYNLCTLLNQLGRDIKRCGENKKTVIPRKMFSLIQEQLERSLPVQENYMLLTKWKLTVLFTTILSKHQPILDWKDTCTVVATEFGNKCNDYLKEDCDKYFSRIYLLFAKALKKMLDDIVPDTAHYDIYRGFIRRENFIQGYLAAIKLIPKHSASGDKRKSQELLNIISEHSGAEIKIHYYTKFLTMEYD